MNKEYALEILNMVECRTLHRDCALVKEALRYLLKLKKLDNEIYNRVYKIKSK